MIRLIRDFVRCQAGRERLGFACAAGALAALTLFAACDRSTSHEGVDAQFAAAENLDHFTRVGTAPMFAVLPSGDEVIAWVSAPDSGSNGRLYVSVAGQAPSELIDPLGPIEAHGEAPPKLAIGSDGTIHAVYVVGKEVPGRRFPLSALRHVRSSDEGRTWSTPQTVTDDDEFGSHNFHALTVGDSGRVGVSWLDGRHGPGSSSAYVVLSDDNGSTWRSNVRVDTAPACPCCRTGFAIAPDGTMYLAWRGILSESIRDIVLSRSRDGGRTWNTPARVHADDWVFNGCPHAGPSLRVDRNGRVHIAWWTGKEGAAGVWYARSDDQGVNFTATPLDVAEFSRPAHVQLAVQRDTVVVTWDDGTREVPRIQLRQSLDGGSKFSPALTLSDTALAASFPVLALTGKGTVVAWSQQSSDSHAHHAASQPNMKDPGAVKKMARVGDARVIVRRTRTPVQ